MSHQDHSPSKRRLLQGAAAVILLSVSPFGFAASSSVVAVRIYQPRVIPVLLLNPAFL